MTSLDSASLIFWESVAEWGFRMVFIGVAGEGAEIIAKLFFKKSFKKHEHSWDIFSGICWLILVVGLAIEFKGTHNVTRLSDAENARLTEAAANTESNSVALSLRVEELRKKNDEFEAKAKDRRITMEQMNNFIFLTEKIRKIPIKICIFAEGRDTETFAKDLREMFTNARFETNSDAGVWGINREPTKIAATKFGVTNEPKSLVFFSYSTNEIVNINGYALEKTNGFERPIITEYNEETIYHGIEDCLQQIGITTDWESDPFFVERGKCEIVIRVK
jgi:hypothetical protein